MVKVYHLRAWSVKVDLFDLAKASLRTSGTRLIVMGETRVQKPRF
ncbi:MAG: hypothetical protein QXG50_04915 [Desulfurococcaceae archaeon]